MVPHILMLSRRFATLTLAMVCGFNVVSGEKALGQNYTQLDIDPKYALQYADPVPKADDPARFEAISDDEKKAITAHNKPINQKIQEDKKKVESILESNGDINNPVFKEFFNGYVFPEMTRLGESNMNLSDLGTKRAQFLKSYLSSKVTGQARNRFIDSICIPSLVSISTNNDLHPAARLSAVYLLGSLDNAVGTRSPATPPTPSQAAFDELMKVMDSKDSALFLKVGAWAGIQRHFEIDSVSPNKLPEPKRARVKAIASDILSDKFADQDQWNDDVNVWMKRRAAQLTGISKDTKALDLLIKVMENKDYPLSLRIDSMEAIGNLGLTKVDEATVKSITRFLSESYQAEANWLTSQVESLKFDNMLFEDLDLELTGTNWNSATQVASNPGAPSGGRNGGAGRGGRGGMVGEDGGGALGGGLGGSVGGPGGGAIGGSDSGLGGGSDGASPDGGEAGGMSEPGGGRSPGRDPGRGGVGEPGPGRGGNSEPAPANAKFVELPNYHLHVSRTRIKTLASSGVKLLKPEINKGLHKVAEAQAKTIIDKVVADLEKIRKDSNVGIKNLDPRANRTKTALDKEEDEKKDKEEKSITQQLTDFCSTTSVKLLEAIGEKPAEKEEPKKEEKEEPGKDGADAEG